jgi:hypothetical protein
MLQPCLHFTLLLMRVTVQLYTVTWCIVQYTALLGSILDKTLGDHL